MRDRTSASAIVACLTACALLLSATPVCSAEPDDWPPVRSLDVEVSDPVLEPVRGRLPVVASDGDGFLVVWSVQNAATTLTRRASRIDSMGRILDPVGIEVTDDEDYHRASVAFGSTMYLVVSGGGHTVRGSGISSDGTVRFRDRTLSIGPLPAFGPKVVWNGRNFVILTSTSFNPPGLAVVNEHGEPLAYHDVELGFESAGDLDFAAGTDRVVVVGERVIISGNAAIRRELVARSLTLSGDPIGPLEVLDQFHPDTQAMPAITAVGDGFVVAWNHGLLRLASISKELDVLAASQIDTVGRDALLPALASDGHKAVVSWATRDDPQNPFSYETTAFTARLSEDLAAVSEPAAVGPVGPEAPRAGIAIGAGRTIAVWNRNEFVYVRGVETADSAKVISLAARRQVSPLLAAGTSEYAVLWLEPTSSLEDPWNFDSSVRLQLLSPGGARYLGDPITLSEDGYGAVVAAGGEVFAAAWVERDTQTVRARVVRAHGASGQAFDLSPGLPISVHVEWDGSAFVVLAVRDGGGELTRISKDGLILGTHKFVVDLRRGVVDGDDLACTADGRCVFAWTGAVLVNEIHAIRFDSYGVLDSAPLVPAKGLYKVNVRAAASPDGFLIAFRDVTGSPWDNEIRVVELEHDGTVNGAHGENGRVLFKGLASPTDLDRQGDGWLFTWVAYPEAFVSPLRSGESETSPFSLGSVWTPSVAVRSPRSFGASFVVRTSDSRLGASERVVVRLFDETTRRRGVRPGQ